MDWKARFLFAAERLSTFQKGRKEILILIQYIGLEWLTSRWINYISFCSIADPLLVEHNSLQGKAQFWSSVPTISHCTKSMERAAVQRCKLLRVVSLVFMLNQRFQTHDLLFGSALVCVQRSCFPVNVASQWISLFGGPGVSDCCQPPSHSSVETDHRAISNIYVDRSQTFNWIQPWRRALMNDEAQFAILVRRVKDLQNLELHPFLPRVTCKQVLGAALVWVCARSLTTWLMRRLIDYKNNKLLLYTRQTVPRISKTPSFLDILWPQDNSVWESHSELTYMPLKCRQISVQMRQEVLSLWL